MSKDTLTLIVLVFGCINLTVIVAALIYYVHSRLKKRIRQNKVNHFGDSAEKKVIEFLKKSFPKATVMDSVYLKTPSGLTELDILMLCDRGIFIIEVKSHNGYIVTGGNFWTQHWRDKVIRFHNPVHQNNSHKVALETVFRKRQSLASLPVYTVVVFTSSNVSFSQNTKDVIKLSSLYAYIRRKKQDKRMTREMIRKVERFISDNMETSRIRQNQHKRKIYQRNSKKRAYRFNR
ncbi:MAG: NERD domain-containing protein [Clostridia bacterium]|nr:NERD domain-containing protein [Clostridia bacterium]